MSVPNPTMLAALANKKRQAALVETNTKAKVVRPGLVESQVHSIHDGVVKAKHLKPGMTVRPYLHGEPRGAERTIASVTRIGDGATVGEIARRLGLGELFDYSVGLTSA